MNPQRFAGIRFCLLSAVLLFAIDPALRAQTILGTWQGTLPDGPIKRIVIKVAKADNGLLRGTFIVIDHSADELPIPSVKFVAPDLSFDIADITYRGKMSEDSKSIAGTWSRPGESYPLTLTRTTPETLWTYTGPRQPPPMDPAADPSFEVATIKPSKPGGGLMVTLRARQFKASNCSAKELIKFAYNVRGRQVDGGPGWIEDDKFDVLAETDAETPGTPSEAQARSMVRKLLEERFGLKVHLSQREFSVYALAIEKSSAKLTRSEANANIPMNLIPMQKEDGQLAMQFLNATMTDFAGLMMNFIQSHQIVDETGLQGKYDFSIELPRSALQTQGPDEMPDPAFVHAIQPLGLKFVLKKESLEMVVVDHLDKPSAN